MTTVLTPGRIALWNAFSVGFFTTTGALLFGALLTVSGVTYTVPLWTDLLSPLAMLGVGVALGTVTLEARAAEPKPAAIGVRA
jgi:hypothetical protein